MSACYTQRLRWGSAAELVVGDTPDELETRVMARVVELRQSGFNPQKLPALMMHRVSLRFTLSFKYNIITSVVFRLSCLV